MRQRLERYFEFVRLKTNWRTEILAGVTTFVTMAYIIFVNPSILQDAGMPFAPVVAATCLSAAVGSLLMGVFARYPIALAPGMGLNAYFTYVVVKGMGIPWQVALGAVFLSGALFVALTLAGVIRQVVSSIPTELYSAIAAGIGLLLALVGFRNSGIIVPNASTTVAMGNMREPNTLLAVFGLLLIAALLAWRVKGATRWAVGKVACPHRKRAALSRASSSRRSDVSYKGRYAMQSLRRHRHARSVLDHRAAAVYHRLVPPLTSCYPIPTLASDGLRSATT